MALRRPARILIAVTLALGLTLAACGSNDDTADASADTPTSSAEQPAEEPADEPAEEPADEPTDAPSEEPADEPADEPTEDPAAALPAECAADQLTTKTAGVLTIATDEPVFEPWFVDNAPESGEGFEGAIAYAVADRLGFAADQVTWMRAGFESVISPAPKDFDFDINEFSITPERAEVVDFSTGYYDVAQAVVTVAGSPIADATSLADLKDATLGAQIGTTSLAVINEVIAPNVQPAALGANIDAVSALQNGQIDGIVTDLPTAFYMAAAQLDDGVIVGQVPYLDGDIEQFGLLLEKDSPITSCVSAAVDSLRADGTLATIADTWLAAAAGAPELK